MSQKLNETMLTCQ